MTAEKFWEAIKAGRSFATTGPMLTLTAGGRSMGATISRSSKDVEPVELLTTVRSIESLESLQIVCNGGVVASLDLLGEKPTPILRGELSHDRLPSRSGWVAARALFRAPNGLLRQAHTSPIYFLIDEKPIAFAEDAEYMLRWIERLEDIVGAHADRFPSRLEQEAVLADYEEARVKYLQVIHDGHSHWRD